MTNVETEIFNIVAAKVRQEFPTVYMTGEYVKSPPAFPCVSLIEMDNSTYYRTLTSLSQENHAQVMYEVNIYSNKTTGKKSECRDIAETIDTAMSELGFVRMMLNPIPNMEDATIYRVLGRYRAVISTDKVVYRR